MLYQFLSLMGLMFVLFLMCYPWDDDSDLSEADLFWKYGDLYD